MQSPEFWRAYFFEDESGTGYEFPTTTWHLRVSDGHAVVLRVERDFTRVWLGLHTPGGGEPLALGWDDQAHWHPDALRWEELDAVARAVAFREPALAHPGLVVLLLCRFAPMTEGEDGDLGASLLEGALRAASVHAETVRRLWASVDVRHAGLRWRNHPGRGPVLEQDPVLENASGRREYTLRSAHPLARFPFAEFTELIHAARATSEEHAARWRTETVRALSDRYVASGDPHFLPALHNALISAGCDDVVLLGACTLNDVEKTWPIEHVATTGIQDHHRRVPQNVLGTPVARIHVPFAPLGSTTVSKMIGWLREAFEREHAGAIVSASTQYGGQGVTGVTLLLALRGEPAAARAAAMRALQTVDAVGATVE
jgi:hypothetical protein